jgi:hypothetical protein
MNIRYMVQQTHHALSSVEGYNRSILGRLWRLPDLPEAGKSPEPRASLCRTPCTLKCKGPNSTPRLGLVCRLCSSAHSFALGLPEACPEFFYRERSLTVPPLPSASILINMFNILTGFTYRGLTPHKFTPMPGVHQTFHMTRR